MNKSEYKSARSSARKILREGFKGGRAEHSKAWDSLGSKVYFFSLDDFKRPVSMACCLFLCEKYGRKTTDFI